MKFFELANQLDKKSLEFLKQCKDYGIEIKNHMSELTKTQEQKIYSMLKENQAQETKKQKQIQEQKLRIENKRISKSYSKEFTNCESCKGKRIVSLELKLDDKDGGSQFELQFDIKKLVGISELPFIDSYSQYAKLSVCLDCGKLQGHFPVSNEQIISLNKNFINEDL